MIFYLIFGLLVTGYPIYLDSKNGTLSEYDFVDWGKSIAVILLWPFVLAVVYVMTLQAMDIRIREMDLDKDDIQDTPE